MSTAAEIWIWPAFVIELALSSRGEQDAFAEQVELGAAIHLVLDGLVAGLGAWFRSPPSLQLQATTRRRGKYEWA